VKAIRTLSALAVSALLGLPVTSRAQQSLGEVAAREQEKKTRKPPPKGPAKVYTDEDLKKAGHSNTAAVTVLQHVVPESEPAAEPAASSGSREAGHEGAGDQSPAWWKERAAERRQLVKDAEGSIQEIQGRIDALTQDREPNPGDLFDPQRLQNRENAKAKALEELAQAKQNLAEAEKALAELEKEAREKGIPLG